MDKLRKSYLRHRDAVLVLLGLLAVSMITLPYLVLGEGSYVQVHDQLDGEVLNYMYQARYLGEGHVIPQFMNGMDKASMLPPAPLGVLLYRLLPLCRLRRDALALSGGGISGDVFSGQAVEDQARGGLGDGLSVLLYSLLSGLRTGGAGTAHAGAVRSPAGRGNGGG